MKVQFDIEEIQDPHSGLVTYKAFFLDFRGTGAGDSEWEAIARLCDKIEAYQDESDEYIDPYQ